MEFKYDEQGLIAAIIQDAESGEVLMLGYMNEESLKMTIESGRTWFWSRSRKEFWCKGETSGNRQYVREIRYDCDGDALLIKVHQVGPACHTGERSCFFRTIAEARNDLEPAP
ncbi:MAG: phosphoribosyl-AMP cyclohydrolase [Actinobacteria bacterium RBG_19FT_COMBO_54_7]|uniref:Phosphoribosyl-AMP cyclohydrolase n=1 Tax=Candidatus Solincola sediminis TaxID=1797199 RepID=A0A1F2WGI2_9ACTN|nr:MAG: phosphoribosyl-AMP cyclohydrolase [Candidatus Solincola sediminis]OFW68994.1 MAG: phosphoribosyl-AMP cyclohydrolase [Actinobacteria bacterium RBG_19FT_COMBO_54_7]